MADTPKDADKEVGRPAEAEADQNRAPAVNDPDDAEKKKAREEFNIHEADMRRNPQG